MEKPGHLPPIPLQAALERLLKTHWPCLLSQVLASVIGSSSGRCPPAKFYSIGKAEHRTWISARVHIL